MSYTLIPLNDVTEARLAGIPWKVRLEYVGYNGDNLSGSSRKFWELYADGKGGDPYVNYGKVGSRGLSNPKKKYLWDAIDVGRSKLKKGYSESPQTSRHWQVPTPAPAIPGKDELAGPPWNNIHHVVECSAKGHFDAVDIRGDLVMKLPASGARKLFTLSPWVQYNTSSATVQAASE